MFKLPGVDKAILGKMRPLMEQGLVSGGNFAIGILLARKMGLEGYGTYMVLWMVVQYFINLHQAFIVAPLQAFYGKYGTAMARDRYVRQVGAVHIAVSVLCALVLFGMGMAFSPLLGLPAADIGLYFSLGLLGLGYLTYDFLRKQQYITGELSPLLLTSALVYGTQIGLLFSFAGGTLALVDVLRIAAAAFFLGSAGLWLRKKTKWSKGDASGLWSIAKEHFVFARWLMATSIVQWLTGNLFFLASGALLGNAAVGMLKMAQNVMGVLHILFLTLENYFPSRASVRLHRLGMDSFKKYLSGLTLKSGLAVMAAVTGLAVFAGPIMEWVYGTSDPQQSRVLQCFALHYVLVFLAIPLRIGIRTLAKNGSIFLANIAAALLASLVAWPMVGAWGIWGAMAGLMAVQALMVMVLWATYRYWTGPRKTALQTVGGLTVTR